MSEIEIVAKALSVWQFETEAAWEDQTDMARAAIVALDKHRAEEKRKNCKHFHRIGAGSLSAAGTTYSWHCPECGASYASGAAVGTVGDSNG